MKNKLFFAALIGIISLASSADLAAARKRRQPDASEQEQQSILEEAAANQENSQQQRRFCVCGLCNPHLPQDQEQAAVEQDRLRLTPLVTLLAFMAGEAEVVGDDGDDVIFFVFESENNNDE